MNIFLNCEDALCARMPASVALSRAVMMFSLTGSFISGAVMISVVVAGAVLVLVFSFIWFSLWILVVY